PHHSPAEIRGQGQIGPKHGVARQLRLRFRPLRGLRAASKGVYSVFDESLFPNERDMLRLSVLRERFVWRGRLTTSLPFSFKGFRPTARVAGRWVFSLWPQETVAVSLFESTET